MPLSAGLRVGAAKRCSGARSPSSEATTWGDREAEAHALYTLDWAWVSLGQPGRAVNSQRALQIYAELGDLAGEAAVLNNLGIFAYFRGEWDEASRL